MASTRNNFSDDHDIYHPSELRKRQNIKNIFDYDTYYKYSPAIERNVASVIVIKSMFFVTLICIIWNFVYYYLL